MSYLIRTGVAADLPAIYEIIRRLAEFELPPQRTADMFWTADAKLFATWASGEAGNVVVHVATEKREEVEEVLGVTMYSLGEEFFDHSYSAHLEVVAVAKIADGRGIGRALLAHVEADAKKRGAGSISLHVVGNNQRARYVYQQAGYNEELIRCIKHFD